MNTHKIILLLIISFMGKLSFAQEWETPIIKGYGPIKYYKDAKEQPLKNVDYKIIFDITSDKEKDGVNKALWKVARQINLMGAAKVPQKNIHIVAILHGPATPVTLSDETYLKKYNTHNPNLDLLKKLKENGVEIYICGQAAAENNIDPYTELNPYIELNLSALITVPNFVLKGYTLMP